ncbi:MAG: hypothetical protein Q8L85_04095 [Alphaproteobacteria bacterium]|jgi:hypothetical protein|nr:hypothetical protein [Alphaproteobacteria bacterium]MDP3532338.1 hypothetical protein [Alphaproteobacteria bacterium]
MLTSVQSTSFFELSPLDDGEDLMRKLSVLKNSYKKIDEEIQKFIKTSPSNQLQLARLQQVKKNIKVQIDHFQSELHPNIVA